MRSLVFSSIVFHSSTPKSQGSCYEKNLSTSSVDTEARMSNAGSSFNTRATELVNAAPPGERFVKGIRLLLLELLLLELALATYSDAIEAASS